MKYNLNKCLGGKLLSKQNKMNKGSKSDREKEQSDSLKLSTVKRVQHLEE